MKKAIKILGWITVGLVFFIFLFVRIAEWQLAKKLPEVIQAVSGSDLALSVGEVKQGKCLFRICLDLEDLMIKPVQYNPIKLKEVSLKIPPLWPPRVDVNAVGADNWVIDGTFSRWQWDVRAIRGNIENLDFDLSGNVDVRNESGELILKTRNLRDFLTEFTDMPKWMSLFIQNISQEFILKPQNGALRFEGIPLLWFSDLK